MRAEEYKKVVAEAQSYINKGKPLAAWEIHELHQHKFTFKQYYDLVDLINAAVTAMYGEEA